MHYQPIGQIIYNYGPAFFSHGLAHKIFTGLRLSIINTGIQFQKSTFLAEDAWKTIPFSQTAPNPFQKLLNHMSSIPGLLEGVSKLHISATAQKTSFVDRIYHSCEQLVLKLDKWYDRYKDPGLESKRAEDEFPSDSEYQFSDHANANGMLLYWASLVIVQTVSYRLLPYTNVEQDVFSLRANAMASAREAATSIVRSSGWFSQPDRGMLGRYMLGFPAGVALKFFASQQNQNNEPYYFRTITAGEEPRIVPENADMIWWLVKIFKMMNMEGHPLPKEPGWRGPASRVCSSSLPPY